MTSALSVPTPLNTVFSPEEIQRFRKETAGTRHVIHLNNAGAGLMPDVVTQAQLDHISLESRIGGYEASALQAEAVKAFYQQCALLLNCKPSNIAFTASATDSYTRALSAIPFEKDDVILTDRDDFVSNQIQFLSLQKRIGVRIVHINNAAVGGVDLNDLKEKLYHYRPKLLAITHIPTNSGLVQPVHEIAAVYSDYVKAHPGKTWYILDACQSAGQMKLDVKALQCDFLSMTCRKFLRGPRGTGALYIADRALEAGLEPMYIDMRGAEWTTKDTYQQQPDAKRFEDWEFAYATVIGTKAAIEYCLQIGEERIWQQVRLMAAITREKLAAIDKVAVLDRGPEKGGLVTFHVAGSDPVHIVSGLSKRKINVVPSYRAFGLLDFDDKGVKWAVRASPHYYNTVEEIDAFIASLREII
ncbi:aminotransferase class V-fold PLP-dependent enzyme [Chitinophaga oryzae]|uniref:Aminotransferase class V-fold PLP-dependent enzyme n=1 Tax=Chitinophaga oryzae TaxID=2725414 RepID=A0AAE6ZJT9_9BACT|nr:aminotransferase class V-fold PLP-dependent enzyme [Chitinophaga oryzae]QJB33473.1 aminotransferase class V-fold PLP-dependent enzyme [Chitinophaga oryzae]QJB39992.1 aminotransferase class V-fold PLP-dependent enzyme [Chitinophaga oryzae]